MIHIVIIEFNYPKASICSQETTKNAVINSMKNNKRRNLRFELPVDVKLTTKDGNELILKSHNISDCGIFLNGTKDDLPNVGEEVIIKLASMVVGDEPREIKGLVVRYNSAGIGIQFLLEDEV